MGVFRFIDMKILLVSLALGLFAVYITMPDQRLIYVYPTPENVDVMQYKDSTDTCFSIKQTEVACPINEKDIAKIPIQA